MRKLDLAFRLIVGLLVLGALAVSTIEAIRAQEEEDAARRNRRLAAIRANIPPPTTTSIPVGDTLAAGSWESIPGSEFTSIFNVPPPSPPFTPPPGGWPANIDDQWDSLGAADSFTAIIRTWGGSTCFGDELFVWGGGHGDGAHNGVFAVNVISGTWRRVTIPAPLSAVLPVPPNPLSQTNADGSPVARHTYNLLTTDDRYLYESGGALWETGTGGSLSPNAWRLDLSLPIPTWDNIANSPRADSHGNLIRIGDTLYHLTANGAATYDIETNVWTAGFAGNSHVRAQSMVVYSPFTDRFYGAGDSANWRKNRADFLLSTGRTNLPSNPALFAARYPGGVYYPPEHKVLWYDQDQGGLEIGGPSLIAYDEDTEAFETITPAGSPGAGNTAGINSLLNYCGGRVVLINGAGNPLWYIRTEPIDPPGPVCGDGTTQAPEECDDGNTTSGDGCSATCTDESVPPAATPSWPVMDTPPGGSLAAFDTWADGQCGQPRANWPVYDVGPGQPWATTTAVANAIPVNTGLAVIRLHWQATPYAKLTIQQRKCVEIIGIEDGPPGERPTIKEINANYPHDPGQSIIPGGIIVRNVIIDSKGTAASATAQDCITPPTRMTFTAVEDSFITQCAHHGILFGATNGSHYVRFLRNHWTKFGSHGAYVDHVGRADIIDNLCETPGNGHCIRTVAYTSHVEGNTVSNVQLDGTAIHKWDASPGVCNQPPVFGDKCSIGMNPLEVYSCTDVVIRNNTIIKFQQNQAGGGVNLRSRRALWSCGVEGKTADGTQWIPLNPNPVATSSARFQHPGFWDIVRTDLDANGVNSRFAFVSTWEDNTVKYTGAGAIGTPFMVAVDSGVPGYAPNQSDAFKSQLRQFVLANPGNTCSQLAALSPDPDMAWSFLHVVPSRQTSVCTNGTTPDFNTFRHPDNWEERSYMIWGTGNVLEACPNYSLDNCAPATGGYGYEIDNNSRESVYFHAPYPQPPGFGCTASSPGQTEVECHDKFVNVINNGGARIRYTVAETP